MYRCEKCDRVVGPGVESFREVVETRRVVFPLRKEVNRVARRVRPRGHRRVKWVDDPGGTGEQIVRELMLCPACRALRLAATAAGSA